MVIKGLQKLSLIDYPGHICATVFTAGCNFRCPYCHNPELVDGSPELPVIPQAELLHFLRRRRKFLDGVTITGGEPTLHHDLPELLAQIKSLGLKVKLDTNGSNPALIETPLDAQLVDCIGLDIKSSPARYSQAAGVPVCLEDIARSLELTLARAPSYELRCTILPRLHDERTLRELGQFVRGAKLLYLQRFRATKVLDPAFSTAPPFPDDKMHAFAQMLGEYVQCCRVR